MTTLLLSSGERITDPTNEEILSALGTLDIGRDGEGFAILERDDMTYIQASGDRKIGFDIEYQEGDLKKHYRAQREDFSLEEVMEAFVQYRDGEVDCSRFGKWSRIVL